MYQAAWKASRRSRPFDNYSRHLPPEHLDVRGVRFVPGASAIPDPYARGHQLESEVPRLISSSSCTLAQTALLHTHYVQTYAPLHSYTRSRYTLRHNTHLHVTDVCYTQRHHHMLRHTCTHIDTCVHLYTNSLAPVYIPTHTQTHAPRYANTWVCRGAQTPSKYHHFTMLAQL